MSVTAAAHPGELPTLDVSDTEPVPFGRLVAVELRKMRDTRAGLWLQVLTGGLLVLAAVITLLVTTLEEVAVGADIVVQVMTIPVSLLMPVLAITCVTSEWSQRTGLVTFALVPDRARVLLAKLVTVLLLAVSTIGLAVVTGVATLALHGLLGESAVDWSVDWSALAWTAAVQVLYFLMAFGLGLVVLSTPAAIAIFYVVAMLLPLMVYGPLFLAFSWGQDVIPWIDLGFATTPLTDPTGESEVTGTTYAQTAFTTLLWVVAPLVGGFARVARAEIS
jgi:ABC-type transport system involved in multi-copper enzyme maturation permease subunit